MKVYDLLHPDGSSWDIDMVEGLLSPYDNGFCAGGLVGFRHRIIWHFTHNGMYQAQTVSPQPSTGGEVQWRKPLTGKLKCNIDGAVFTNNGVVGWAAIVRSDSGRFVRCIAVFKRRNLDPFMAEVIAAQEALSWVRSCHAKGIILEIDNRGL
ncbi:hypothetical protein Goarm_016556 [Gossypium armourianum]|uniref:RNase H type-1 domain-containing protein n=1 Tax=Gossypium armourianum TaxID=34283 RepID=A0A7J9JCL6_9ROSI|nr:hypothetical protein [Gossypium armourianum]